jgi:hypothetical protein
MREREREREKERGCVFHEICAEAEERIFTTEKFVNANSILKITFKLKV